MSEKLMIYYGYYKCRMCGKEFYNFSCPDQWAAIEEIRNNKRRITSYHYHDDNSLGYSDFIGYRKEEAR